MIPTYQPNRAQRRRAARLAAKGKPIAVSPGQRVTLFNGIVVENPKQTSTPDGIEVEFEPTPEISAHHESGHAIVARVLGFKVTALGCRGGKSGLGFCRIDCDSFKGPALTMNRNVVLWALAGEAAVTMLLGYPCENASEGDMNTVRAATACLPAQLADSVLKASRDYAAKLVCRHWETIRRLAALVLERRGELNEAELSEFFAGEGI